jgi:hypothetical protein
MKAGETGGVDVKVENVDATPSAPYRKKSQ